MEKEKVSPSSIKAVERNADGALVIRDRANNAASTPYSAGAAAAIDNPLSCRRSNFSYLTPVALKEVTSENPDVSHNKNVYPNDNNNNSSKLKKIKEEISSSDVVDSIVPLFQARTTLSKMLKQVSSDCARVESKSREIADVMDAFDSEDSDSRRRSSAFNSTARMRTKAEREQSRKLKDNLVAKLRSLQSSARELEAILKLVHRLEQDVALRSEQTDGQLETLRRSNALLRETVARQEAEMAATLRQMRRMEDEAVGREGEKNMEVVALLETTERMKEEMRKMRSNHAQLVDESQRVMERLGLAEEERDNLEATLQLVRGEKTSLERTVVEQEETKRRQKRKIEEGKEKMGRMSEKVEGFQGEMRTILSAIHDRESSDGRVLRQMQRRVDEALESLAAAEQEKRRLQQTVEERDEEIRGMRSTEIVRRAEEDRAAASRVFHRVQEFLGASTDELKTMDAEAAELEKALATAEADVAVLKEEVIRLTSTLDSYERHAAAAAAENADLRRVADERLQHMRLLEAAAAEERLGAENLRRKMSGYVDELRSMPERLREVETELAAARAELTSYREEIRVRDRAIEDREAAAEAAAAEKAALQTELDAKREELIRLQEVEAKSEADAKAVALLKEEIERLYAREDEYGEVLKTLAEKCDDDERVEAKVLRENAALRSRARALCSSRRRVRDRLERAEADKSGIVADMEREKKRIFETLTEEKKELSDLLERMSKESVEGFEAMEERRKRSEEEMERAKEEAELLGREKAVLLEEIDVLKEKESVLEQLLRSSDQTSGEEWRKEREELKKKVEEAKKEAEKEAENHRIDFEEKLQTEYSEKFGSLQAELRSSRRENRRLSKTADSLKAELAASTTNWGEERAKRENLERHLARLRGLHSRLFLGEGDLRRSFS